MNIVLYQPEIPENTGNIGRTCYMTGTTLHLIKPLGFNLDDKKIKRAGLDYWFEKDYFLKVWDSYEEFLENEKPKKIYMATTKTDKIYTNVKFEEDDYIMFGPETRGIPENILRHNEYNIKIPMKQGRSLNLSNSVAIILYEGLRQLGFFK